MAKSLKIADTTREQREQIVAGLDRDLVTDAAALGESFHDLEHMERLVGIGAERSAALQGLRHVGQTQRAAVVRIIEHQLDVLHALSRLEELDRTAEAVGDGDAQGTKKNPHPKYFYLE